ncbi:hypothetical protein GCM10010195_62440 [Kitasatospora griseola]|nr:hypothetical protein GCM10010195_62440 [Kitasatospora griseola]
MARVATAPVVVPVVVVVIAIVVVVRVLGHRGSSAAVSDPEVNPNSEEDPKAALVTVVVLL